MSTILAGMDDRLYDKMVAENRERVHLDDVVRGDPFEPYSLLFLGTSFLAEETLSVADGFGIYLGCGRNHPGRIVLDLHLKRFVSIGKGY